MIITDIKNQKKHLKALYTDDEFTAYIDTDILRSSKFKIGMQVSQSELDKLIFDSDLKRSKNKAIYLLGFRDYSKKELAEKLKKDFSLEAVEETIANLVNKKLINEEDYAKRYANKLFNEKLFSSSRMRYELIKKGFEREIIENLLSNYDTDPIEKIIYIIDKKFQNSLYDEKSIKRTIAGLQRLGYFIGDIKHAVELYLREHKQIGQDFNINID